MRRQRLMPLALIVATAWVVSCAEQESTEPTLPDVPAPSGDVAQEDLIPGQYIVVFNDDVANPVQLAGELAAAHGLTLRHTYEHAIKGFSAVVPEGAVAALERNPNVRYIEQNRYMYIDTHEILRKRAIREYAAALAAAPPQFDPPSNLAATAVSTSQINLTWVDNSKGESGFEIIRCGPGTTDCVPSEPVHAMVGSGVTSFSDTGLQSGMRYCYRVRAYKQKGKKPKETTGWSNTACATTNGEPPPPPPPPDPPAGPSDLLATPIDHQQIDLSWTDNSEPPGVEEDGFRIERCGPNPEGTNCTDFADHTSVGNDVTTFSDVGLDPEMEYCYQVIAFNAGGDSPPSNASCATTLTEPPPPPPPPPGACPDNPDTPHDPLTDPGLWGIVKIKADQNEHWKGVQDNGPECAMQAWFFGLDTGVDSDHPDLNVVEIMTFLTGDNSGGEDGHGHGSHTAGTAAAIDGGPAGGVVGVAPGAAIHGFKVCTDGGSCPLDAIIGGVDEVTARKIASPDQPMVANMSLGGGGSTSIDQAVRHSVSVGVVYTLSAGNGVFGACFFPADAQNSSPARVGDDIINGDPPDYGGPGDNRVNGAITTTSSGQNDTDVNCNFGNPVTVASPGNGIKSTWLNGGYNTISGTSMAAPHSAGAAILVLQGNPNYTPIQVEQEIVDDLDNWTTNDLPNADGRLDARCLGTGDTSCAGNN